LICEGGRAWALRKKLIAKKMIAGRARLDPFALPECDPIATLLCAVPGASKASGASKALEQAKLME
jgi:hypothetical protein